MTAGKSTHSSGNGSAADPGAGETSSRPAVGNAGACGRGKDRMKIFALTASAGAADPPKPRLEEFVVHPF